LFVITLSIKLVLSTFLLRATLWPQMQPLRKKTKWPPHEMNFITTTVGPTIKVHGTKFVCHKIVYKICL